ncbi:MAG: hypothetical protein NDI61_05525 [Bdellovibrionaceae bacterium]|nr:hypothetical protein [Pseudobdellovibrionaceae bacterium]
MRLTWIFAILFGLTLALVSNAAQAADKKPATCKVETADIGTIVGRGPDREVAFEDAATKCFDRRRQLYKARYGRESDMETGELYIDICANVKCS